MFCLGDALRGLASDFRWKGFDQNQCNNQMIFYGEEVPTLAKALDGGL